MTKNISPIRLSSFLIKYWHQNLWTLTQVGQAILWLGELLLAEGNKIMELVVSTNLVNAVELKLEKKSQDRLKACFWTNLTACPRGRLLEDGVIYEIVQS